MEVPKKIKTAKYVGLDAVDVVCKRGWRSHGKMVSNYRLFGESQYDGNVQKTEGFLANCLFTKGRGIELRGQLHIYIKYIGY